VNAASGTCPPFGNAEDDAMGPPPNAAFEAVAADAPEDDVEERLAFAADKELVGPNNCVVPVPPATSPEDPLELAMPVRI